MTDAAMDSYKRIAAQHGIDSTDESAVLQFFREVVPSMPKEQRDELALNILSASTGVSQIALEENTPEPGVDVWASHLQAAADGIVNLRQWDGNVLKYMQSLAPSLLGLLQLEMTQSLALDQVFASLRPVEFASHRQRAAKIIPWARDYQSLAVVEAFTRCMFVSRPSGLQDQLGADATTLSLGRLAQEYLPFLDSLLNDCAHSDPVGTERRAYEDLMVGLRRFASLGADSSNALANLVVMERDPPLRAAHFVRLLTMIKSTSQLDDIERRLGLDAFYPVVRLALYNISMQQESIAVDQWEPLLQWVSDFVSRRDVYTRDLQGSAVEGYGGDPLRHSWMRLHELYYTSHETDLLVETEYA